jgi:hypothetical protein
MPDDFDAAQHRLQAVRVGVFCDIVLGTFEADIPTVEDYFGPEMSQVI